MRYFKNRSEAGKILAKQLADKYQNTECAVVALSDGSVMVAAQIALQLKAVLTMLLAAPITLPREINVLASVNQEGDLTYSDAYSTGELEDLRGEYRTLIDQERQRGLHDINKLLGAGVVIREDLLRGRNVILVSDGLNSGFSLDAAADFIKPIKIKKLIIATPLASVPAVDRMHILADEIYCLNVLSDYMSTDHYYDMHDVPDHEAAISLIKNTVENWK